MRLQSLFALHTFVPAGFSEGFMGLEGDVDTSSRGFFLCGEATLCRRDRTRGSADLGPEKIRQARIDPERPGG